MSRTVPDGWTDIKLNDLLLKTDSGGWGENGTCKDIPVLRSTNITKSGQLSYEKLAFRKFSEKNKLDFLKHGDMLIEKSGGSNDWSVGRVVYFDKTENYYYFANFMQRIRVNPEKAFWKYIFYFLFDFYRKGGTKSLFQKTTGIQNLRINEYLLKHIPLPPLPEQRKIAAILSSVDSAIEKTKTVIEQTKVVKKALMQELFIRGIPGRHKKFKKTPIGMIPEEWEVVRLEKLGVFSSGFTINQDRVPKNNPRPYLRVANVQKGYFLLNEIKFIEATNEEFSSRQIQRNDILILEGHANLNELGRCAVAIDEVIGMTHQNHIHRFSPNLSLCDPNYIAFALSLEQVRKLIELEGGTTSGLHTLNRNSIASVPIALPSLSEQSLITKCILSIHNSFDRNEVFLHHLYNIKSALMQVLLTGEVRVKV